MLNSLVRVSRRVRWAAVYSPPNLQCATLKVFASQPQRAEPVSRPSSTTLQPSAKPNAYAGTCRLDRLTNKRATTRRETPTSEEIRLHNASQADAKRQRRRRTNNESASAAASADGQSFAISHPANLTDHQLNSLLCLRGPICLPLSGFTHCFTLSSKFFSIFHHCTCSLSDSWSYLAFDGVYHRLHLVLANKATLW